MYFLNNNIKTESNQLISDNQEILNLTFRSTILKEDISIRNYIQKFIISAWKGDTANSKWQSDLYKVLVEKNKLGGYINEHSGRLESVDVKAADEMITNLVEELWAKKS